MATKEYNDLLKERFLAKYGNIMAKNIRKDLVEIYKANPEFFKERLPKFFKENILKVVYSYLDENLSLYHAGKKHHVSKAKTRSYVAETLLRIQAINNMKTEEVKPIKEEEKDSVQPISLTEPILNEDQEPLFKKPGVSLGKKEFDAIKEMLFRGELVTEISQITGRAYSTINKIRNAGSYEEYRTLQQETFKKPAGVAPLMGKKEPEHYFRLREIREQFDEVLINFIKTELEVAQKEIVLENQRLKTENEVLLNRIEALEKPNFIKKLQEGIHNK